MSSIRGYIYVNMQLLFKYVYYMYKYIIVDDA